MGNIFVIVGLIGLAIVFPPVLLVYLIVWGIAMMEGR